MSKMLRRLADYVIYDGAAGLGEEAVGSMEAADQLVIVTNPEILAVTDALKTAKLAEEMGKDVLGVIVTRKKNSRHEMPIANIREMLDLPVLGVVPEDGNVQGALVQKDAVFNTHPRSKSSQAYKKIAAKIAGVSYSDRGIFARIFGR